jgi:RNA polymerase sigma-70 factor (ECF subfamily)
MVSISDESVEDLIGRARDGESTALDQLLEVYRNYISLLARLQVDRRLQGRISPSDLVQDTIMRAGRHFVGFRGCSEGELVVWLRRMLASQVARLYRHHSAQLRDFHLEQQLDSELDHSSQLLQQALPQSQSSPSRSVVRREEAVLLADALEQLPKDYREVILLRNLEGLSFEEVAERMERTVHSVKNLWTRALSKLQDAMCDD